MFFLDANWDVKVDLFFWKDVEEIQNEEVDRNDDDKVNDKLKNQFWQKELFDNYSLISPPSLIKKQKRLGMRPTPESKKTGINFFNVFLLKIWVLVF